MPPVPKPPPVARERVIPRTPAGPPWKLISPTGVRHVIEDRKAIKLFCTEMELDLFNINHLLGESKGNTAQPLHVNHWQPQHLFMGAVTLENRRTLPLAMASDRSLSSASPSSRAPHESPCLVMAGAGSSTTIQRLLPIRSARPRERFSDLLTMINGKSMATLSYKTPWVFELRARLRAQQSSLLMELESCFF